MLGFALGCVFTVIAIFALCLCAVARNSGDPFGRKIHEPNDGGGLGKDGTKGTDGTHRTDAREVRS